MYSKLFVQLFTELSIFLCSMVRLMILGDQPSLPDHHCALVWQWFLQHFQSYLSGKTEQQQLQQEQQLSEEELGHSTSSDQGLTIDMQLRDRALSPSIFDSDG